jgi:putative ABC transport system permease protein
MTLTIEATLSRGQENPTLFANEAYHLEIIPRSVAANLQQARKAAESTEGISAVVTESWFLGDLPGRSDPVILRALAGDSDEVLPTDLDAGRPVQGPGEVMLTVILARQLGLAVGDTFAPTVSYFAGAAGPQARETLGEVPLRVVGTYSDTDDDGQQALLLTSTFADVDLAEVPSSVGLRVADVTESEQVSAALAASLGPGLELFDELAVARDDLASASSDTRPALLGLTALLVVIAVANVLSTLLFAMRERYREVGVLKAVGFAPSDIAWATATGAMVLACVAVVIGIPAGLWITERLFDHFGAQEGWTPGVAATPPAWQLALLVPASLAVAVAGALLPARRASAVSPADALRFE